jgi:hypothetical protein
MPATLHQLQTHKDRLKVDQAAKLRQAVLAFPDLPERAAGEILAAIDRQTASAHSWSFVMLSPAQNRAVVKWIGANSKRPFVAVQLWAELFLHLRRDTGEVMQTREELAAAVGVTPDHVSEIMGELEAFGAIAKERIRVAGMRGPGMVRYRMNPRVATHQTGVARDKAQASAPTLLRLVDGPAKP